MAEVWVYGNTDEDADWILTPEKRRIEIGLLGNNQGLGYRGYAGISRQQESLIDSAASTEEGDTQ